VLFEQLVATSAGVTATPARSAKVEAIAGLLRRLDADEVEPVVAWLSGEPRQGKVGVGWATVFSVDVAHAADPSLTIEDVDRAIDSVARMAGPGSAAARQARLADLLGRATPAEADFLRRLLVGELRQGALEGVMTEAVARAAAVPVERVRRAAMLRGDLPGVAALAVRQGDDGLAGIGLTVLRPILPMLASPSPSVEEALATLGRSSVEWKLDGARIQAHRAGDQVRLFTRNLNDVTDRLPGLTSIVAGLPVDRVVLDGEVLGMGDGDRPDPFQATMSTFSRQNPGADRPEGDRGVEGSRLAVWFFDCLHVDGRDLIEAPLVERMAALDRVAAPWRVPATLTEDPAEAGAALDRALAAGHEGVVVKAAGSPYEAGRRGQAWRKVKPVRTLDLVVLAAEWGHGRRRGWLSNLHLGARGSDGSWVMVGKTFKGMTDELLAWQTEALLARQVAASGITVTVRPELVVEVAVDGVQVSTRYPGGVALRFARIRRYRDEKDAEEADTIDAVRALLTCSGHGRPP
jgi:DNA ligase-1